MSSKPQRAPEASPEEQSRSAEKKRSKAIDDAIKRDDFPTTRRLLLLGMAG